MKFLASVHAEAINEIKERFRVGGIPIFVVPDYGLRQNDIAGIGASQRHANGQASWYAVNICLDEQFEDGRSLLDDPNYKVAAPVDVAQFEATMDKLGANQSFEWFSDKTLAWIAWVIVAGVVLGLFYVIVIAS